MGAAPMGRPGWPDLALLTASIARKRMAFTQRSICSWLTFAGAATAWARGVTVARRPARASDGRAATGAAALALEATPARARCCIMVLCMMLGLSLEQRRSTNKVAPNAPGCGLNARRERARECAPAGRG
jgi:hypothetical protein